MREDEILNEVLHVKSTGSRGHSFDEGAASAGSSPSSPAHAGDATATTRSPLRTILGNRDATSVAGDDPLAAVALQCISAAFKRQQDKLVKLIITQYHQLYILPLKLHQ